MGSQIAIIVDGKNESVTDYQSFQRVVIDQSHFDSIARSNGYIKLQPGECVVKYEKWLPYLKKAYDAARLMENHGAFTVKWYYNEWPSTDMLDELTAAIANDVESNPDQPPSWDFLRPFIKPNDEPTTKE